MRKENLFVPDIRNFPLSGPGLLDPGVNIYVIKTIYILVNWCSTFIVNPVKGTEGLIVNIE